MSFARRSFVRSILALGAAFPEAAGPLPAAEGAVSSLEQDREAPSGSHAAGAPGTTPAASAPATELGSTTVVPAAAPPVASEVSPAETRAPEPAPGNPTSAPLDPGGPVEQIAAATRLHLRGRGAGTLEMHLEPAALGRLRLQVTLQEGSLAAYLGTESHAAQQLLMDQAPALRAALQESGLPVETVQIGLELGFATAGDSQRQPKWHPAPAAVATNKLEGLAVSLLDQLGLTKRFVVVCGQDTFRDAQGRNIPKPDRRMLLETIAKAGGTPERAVMVGDSLHDIVAGKAAGMATVAVLTGIAGAQELSPHADVVLPDISALGAWIDARRAV
mgnify:CR=1 FL=1